MSRGGRACISSRLSLPKNCEINAMLHVVCLRLLFSGSSFEHALCGSCCVLGCVQVAGQSPEASAVHAEQSRKRAEQLWVQITSLLHSKELRGVSRVTACTVATCYLAVAWETPTRLCGHCGGPQLRVLRAHVDSSGSSRG
jgi:hypothetical protein